MRQEIRIELPADPKLAAQLQCAPNVVGILLSGVALFNALYDGRDAEMQDSCHGHPQRTSVYHYHSLTNCLNNKPDGDGNSPLVGHGLDGFDICGSFENGRQQISAGLDGCHGRTNLIDPARSVAGAARRGAQLFSPRSIDEPRDDPDRDYDYGAEQEVTPQPLHGVPAHVPDGANQPFNAVHDVEWVESERGQHDADQDRHQNQTAEHGERRAAENPRHSIVAHWGLFWGGQL
jgi:YHYH protein